MKLSIGKNLQENIDMYKHTQGKWEYSNMSGVGLNNIAYACAHIGCGDELLAVLDDEYSKVDKVMADARLMAAAPDLLMALHNLTTWLEASKRNYCAKELHSTSLEHYLSIAQNAINKATNQKYETNS